MNQKYKYSKGDLVLYRSQRWSEYQLAEVISYEVNYPDISKRVTLVSLEQLTLSKTNSKITPSVIKCSPMQIYPENKYQPQELGQRVLVCAEDTKQIELISLHGDIPTLPLHSIGQVIEVMDLQGVIKKIEVSGDGFIYTVNLKDNPWFKIKAQHCP